MSSKHTTIRARVSSVAAFLMARCSILGPITQLLQFCEQGNPTAPARKVENDFSANSRVTYDTFSEVLPGCRY